MTSLLRTAGPSFSSMSTPAVWLDGQQVWPDDPFLVTWRTALFEFFRPVYARDFGFEADVYDCVKSHFSRGRPQTLVAVEPSHHEILEARFELQNWATKKLGEKRARELLDF